MAGPGGLTGELLEAWRTVPTRSADLLQLTAGPAVGPSALAARLHDGGGLLDAELAATAADQVTPLLSARG